jgi:hypothetical protein
LGTNRLPSHGTFNSSEWLGRQDCVDVKRSDY